MSWRSALDDALVDLEGAGTVDVVGDRGSAEVEVSQAGEIGVRLRRVRVRRSESREIVSDARRLARGLRCLPDTLCPVEVDPELGGATLRSHPDSMRDREFFELGLCGGEAHLSRRKVGQDGSRTDVDWTMTRDDLGRLLDELA